ncbi:HAMP domain-containing sensor histidine kinase [Clostridium sp.]|uniref:sensor histidine kinase n=1 Tax=Clostridium sp. TaxID=1506 RepID=UPI003216B043
MNARNIFPLKPNKKKYIVSLLLLTLVLSLNYTFAYALVTPNYNLPLTSNYKEILILTSQNESDLWESKVLDKLKSSLLINDLNISIKTESLSLVNKDELYLDKQMELWSLKYANTSFDLIIPLDDESLNFIGKYYTSDIFLNKPVIYGGINDVTKLSSYPYNNFTGVMEPINVRALIDLILQIDPQTTTINILLDNTIACNYIENLIKDSMPYYKEYLNFNFIKSDYINDIHSCIEKCNIHSPSILVGNFKNEYDTMVSPNDVVETIKKHTQNKLYTLNESYIEAGVIGGEILYSENHSKTISEMALRVLNGDSLKNIPRVYDSGSVFVFDSNELSANYISRNIIPKNSIIINDNWFNKGVSVAMVTILLAVLVICMLMLAIQTIQKTNNDRKASIAKKKYSEILVNDKIKTEFLANFSHEIRTLLNVMLSGLQLLDIYKDTDRLIFTNKEDETKLVYIRQNGFRLLKLINNLIDMTKIDSGFYNVEFEVKNIVDVVEDITMSVVEYANYRDISITFDTNQEEVYMPLDSEKLDRIILNLLSNAIKFTPKYGHIYVTLDCCDTSVSVSVKDTGIGIPKDKQANIFQRFTQVKNSSSRTKGGSGIGLSLVKSLVELLDGSIVLSSEPNQGCEFKFTLPIKEFDKATEDVKHYISQNITNNSDKLIVEFSDVDSYLNM